MADFLATLAPFLDSPFAGNHPKPKAKVAEDSGDDAQARKNRGQSPDHDALVDMPPPPRFVNHQRERRQSEQPQAKKAVMFNRSYGADAKSRSKPVQLEATLSPAEVVGRLRYLERTHGRSRNRKRPVPRMEPPRPPSPPVTSTSSLPRRLRANPVENMGLLLQREGKEQSAARATSPSAFLPSVTGSVCPPRLLRSHPFFQGVSEALLDDMLRETERRRFDSFEADGLQQQQRSLWRGGGGMLQELFDKPADWKQAVTLCRQGEVPSDEVDGVHITFVDECAEIETTFNGMPLSIPRGAYILGMDVSLGLATAAPFSARLRREPLHGLFFLHRHTFERLLEVKKYAPDVALLKSRTRAALGAMLQECLLQNAGKVKIRLFSNMSQEFRVEVISRCRTLFFGAGSTIRAAGRRSDACLCVVKGEAEAKVDDTVVFRISQSQSQAWAAWWGFSEALGRGGLTSPADVVASTDCVALELSTQHLAELRELYPIECGFFDKVAVKQIQLLTPCAPDILRVPLLKDCGAAFLAELEQVATQHICLPGELVTRQHEQGQEMFILARGSCAVLREGHAEPINALRAGDAFEELALLGVSSTRTTTVVCDAVCDIRSLERAALLEVLEGFPEERRRLEQMAEARRDHRNLAMETLGNTETFRGFSTDFLRVLSDCFFEQPMFVGQTFITQNEPGHHLYVLMSGTAEILVDGNQIAMVKAPAVLGERAVLNPGVRSTATVRSATMCDCLVVHTDQVSAELHEKFPEDMKNIASLLEKRKASITKRMRRESVQASRTIAAKQQGFLAGRDPAFLQDLARRAKREVHFDGQVIMEQGVQGSRAHIVESGTCVVEADGEVVGEVMAGDILGEMVLLGMSLHHTATVRASGTVVTFAVGRDEMLECLRRFPKERDKLLEIVRERQRKNNRPLAAKAIRRALNRVEMLSAMGVDADDLVEGREAALRVLGGGARRSLRPRRHRSRARGRSLHGRRCRSVHSRSTTRFRSEDTGSDSESGSSGEDGEEPCSRSQWPGREDAERWLRKRREAMDRAEAVRMVRTGEASALIPPTQGFRASAIGPGTPFAGGGSSTARTPRWQSAAATKETVGFSSSAVSRSSSRDSRNGIAGSAAAPDDSVEGAQLVEDTTSSAAAVGEEGSTSGPPLPPGPGRRPHPKPPPSLQRLRKAKGVYSRPVWNEVFASGAHE